MLVYSNQDEILVSGMVIIFKYSFFGTKNSIFQNDNDSIESQKANN